MYYTFVAKPKHTVYFYHLILQTENEANAKVEDLKSVLLAKKLTLQPVIVLVGTIVNFRKIYVVINDNWYESTSFLKAVDLSFKSFFALDCNYPASCSNIWFLIQFGIYEIPLPLTGVALKVKTIAKQIAEVYKRHQK